MSRCSGSSFAPAQNLFQLDRAGLSVQATLQVGKHVKAQCRQSDWPLEVKVPYKVTASFPENPTNAEASVDMTGGNVDMWIQEIVTEFNGTLALTIALIGALLLGILLIVIARKD